MFEPQLFNSDLSQIKVFFEGLQFSSCMDKILNPKSEKYDPGFNVFSLISDTYKKENFHSDIIASLLKYNHNSERANNLLGFLSLLISKGCKIKSMEYLNSEILREEKSIDILIRNSKSKKAIIIENKINGAIDQQEQLPRYYNAMIREDYTVDAIVYISLDGNKRPDTSSWKHGDKDKILNILIPISAIDLVNDWLKYRIYETGNLDEMFILRHYKNLLTFLAGEEMENKTKEEFYEYLIQDSNYSIAQSVHDFMRNLLQYRAEKLLNYLIQKNIRPFEKTWIYLKTCTVIDKYQYGSSNLAVDIKSYPDCYSFEVFDRNQQADICGFIKSIGLEKEFCLERDRMVRKFKFPGEEKSLYDFVDKFLSHVSSQVLTK